MVDRITAADLSYPVLTRKVGGGLRELLDVSKIRWRSMPIEFPKGEVKDLAARLNRGKPIYTTRVSAERGRYSSGMSVSSVLGDLKVTSVKHGVGVKTHPFLGELSPEHKKAIGNKPYDLVRLEKRAAPDYGALGFEKLPGSGEGNVVDQAQMAKMRSILMGLKGGSAPNPYRMQSVFDKIRAQRELAEGPRRIEHVGGYYKYPPIEGGATPPPSPAEAASPVVQKTAERMRPQHVILRGS